MKKFITFIICISIMLFSLTGCVTVVTEAPSTPVIDNVVYNTSININTVDSSTIQKSDLVTTLKTIRKSVVDVNATLSNGTSAGSGVVYGYTEIAETDEKIYYIMTCFHVIDGSNNISVADINGTKYTAKLIGGDEKTDVAVIAVSSKDNDFTGITFVCATIRKKVENVDFVDVGESVIAIGNPLGVLGGTVTRGIVSSTDRVISVEGKKMTLIQTDCAINSGNSGGGLFSEYGELIGIVNAGYSGEVEGLNFAIPLSLALDIANELTTSYHTNGNNYGYIDGRALITIADMTNYFTFDPTGYDIVVSTQNHSQKGYYILVRYVKEGSAFEKCGLTAGDIIISAKYGEETFEDKYASKFVTFIQNLELTLDTNIVLTIKSSIQATTTKDIEIELEQYIYSPEN